MSGADEPDVVKISLWDIFNKLPNLRLWDKVRKLAVRGTVAHPELEPLKDGRVTAIKGLYELIYDRSDGLAVIDALRAANHPELAHEVELMLKDYQMVPAYYTPVPPDPSPSSV